MTYICLPSTYSYGERGGALQDAGGVPKLKAGTCVNEEYKAIRVQFQRSGLVDVLSSTYEYKYDLCLKIGLCYPARIVSGDFSMAKDAKCIVRKVQQGYLISVRFTPAFIFMVS